MMRSVVLTLAVLAVSGCADGAGMETPAGDVPPLTSATSNSTLGGVAAGSDSLTGDPTASGTAGAAAPSAPTAGAPAMAGAPAPTEPAVAGAPSDPSTAGMGSIDPLTPEPTEPAPTDPGTGVTGGSADPAIPALSADCPQFVDGTITFMGLRGIQIVAGAKPAGPTAPMVFYWHGTGSFAGEYAGMAGAVAEGVRAEGGVLVSFQGTTGGDLLSGTSVFGRGDLDLVDQLVACAVQNHNVDPRRIYTTGCSAGGLFATAMAALRSSYVAAAAPNSGGFTFPQQFENSYTPALMTIHGAAGRDVVIIDFSDSSATADRAFKDHGGFVINCDHGGGHCGGGGLAPDIWEFFKAHPYGAAPSPWEGGLPAGFHSSCMIY